MNLQDVKQRFEIIGHSPLLNIALETAIKVAPTDITVLINGESGVGKESFSKIIHHLSTRKHGPFIAVNCGAIPEGTIDSELFGHEKGAFTGANETRKGYFETVNGGTIFLDEVGELPLETQARLLRVLESGEFIKVGSSKVQKTDVRVVAATNRDLLEQTQKEKFREDLYYRLSTVPIKVPPLRERKDDILLLFRKFSSDFSEKYKMDPITLDQPAREMMLGYRWPGNIRQLKNITEQLSVLEENRLITAARLDSYLPRNSALPMISPQSGSDGMSERDIFYKVLFDLKKDLGDLKQVVFNIIANGSGSPGTSEMMSNMDVAPGIAPTYTQPATQAEQVAQPYFIKVPEYHEEELIEAMPVPQEEESLSLEHKELELIKKALDKHKGRRRKAARELGISERTLYRKIKQYALE